MKSRRTRRQPDEVRFDFAPMVDVVLILLIFFFLAARLTPTQSLPIELPQANTQQTPSSPILISLDRQGRLSLDGKGVNLAELEAGLKQAFATGKKGVVLEADKTAQHGVVVSILNLVRSLGGTELEIATLPETP